MSKGSLSGFGKDWEIPVSKARASELVAQQGFRPDQLPRIGYEMRLAVYNDPRWPDYHHYLLLQNVCGCMVLACSSMPVKNWHVFGVAGIGDQEAVA